VFYFIYEARACLLKLRQVIYLAWTIFFHARKPLIAVAGTEAG
jgi:hypothetical protein